MHATWLCSARHEHAPVCAGPSGRLGSHGCDDRRPASGMYCTTRMLIVTRLPIVFWTPQARHIRCLSATPALLKSRAEKRMAPKKAVKEEKLLLGRPSNNLKI